MIRRYRVKVDDVYIETAIVDVYAKDMDEAKLRADELVAKGEGDPEDEYRRFDIDLIEESDYEYGD